MYKYPRLKPEAGTSFPSPTMDSASIAGSANRYSASSSAFTPGKSFPAAASASPSANVLSSSTAGAYGLNGQLLEEDRSSASHSQPNRDEVQENRPAEQKQSRAITIWLVEDSATDAFVIGEVLRHSRLPFHLILMTDGDAALVRLKGLETSDWSAIPDLVLLDLNLPKVSGIQVLAALRQSRSCGAVPVIVVTSSDSASDMKAIGDLGVTSYFRKPHSLDAFMSLSEVIKRAIAK